MKATTIFAATAAYLAGTAVAIGLEDHIQARAPVPTPAPNAQHLNRALHRVRAITADLEQTCGFADGDAFRPVSCRAGRECVLNSLYDVGGCCATSLPVTDCALATTCVDYALATYLTYIGDYTVACDDPSFPSCLGYLYETYTFFGCGTTRTLITLEVTATYSGTLGGGARATTSAPIIPDVTRTASQSGVVAPFASVASQGSANSPSATNFVQSQPSGKTGLSTGAIAGIAVACAVVAITGIAAIGIVMWRRNKSKRQAADQRLSQAQMMMNGQPGPDPSNPGGPGSPSVAGSGMPHSPAPPQSPFTPPPMSQQFGPPSASGHGSSQFEGSGKTGMVTVMPNGMDQRFSGQHGSTQWFGSDSSGADGRMSPPVAQIPPQHQFAGREDIMSNDGTASVLPQHPHNPPHIS